MAEQEVAKHTKQVYRIWSSKEHGFWHKFKEFLVEIIIIVFAVTLSIWLHDKSEHAHQQKEVKEFLLGLREDLQSDVKEMQGDRASYVQQQYIFSYIAGIKLKDSLNVDTLRKYLTWMNSTTRLQQNDGRFQGFKASGKIGNIEDKIIQDDIMDLYQESIPTLLSNTDPYIRWKYLFFDFLAKNQHRITDSTSNMRTILLTDEAHNLCGYLANPSQIIKQYDNCIVKMEKIAAEIAALYNIKEK